MGFFEAVDLGFARAQAVLAIERLLAWQVECGVLDAQPNALAEQAVSHIWAQRPQLFEGKFGPRPHKLAIVAIALAASARREAWRDNVALQINYTLALGHVLDEVAHEADHLYLHDADRRLLDLAAATFSACPNTLGQEPHIDWFGL